MIHSKKHFIKLFKTYLNIISDKIGRIQFTFHTLVNINSKLFGHEIVFSKSCLARPLVNSIRTSKYEAKILHYDTAIKTIKNIINS